MRVWRRKGERLNLCNEKRTKRRIEYDIKLAELLFINHLTSLVGHLIVFYKILWVNLRNLFNLDFEIFVGFKAIIRHHSISTAYMTKPAEI